MANGWSLLVGLIIVVAASVAAWFFAPKNDSRTVWRSTLILSFVSCYLMWAIVFLAQLNPLISPKRADIRPGRVPN
ncbi:ATPase V0 complex subunit E1/e2 [Penicillium argentinense]|uniref:ATPase V0 complex subunit E1/e2 n=1 Tax=Penicillium argentinense TaxID=1131581 RepID=A0A9W9G5U2_9EURO|nr:ATPase V0 complex subunit E1/e2 [Penicillium argentinense]KAJ5112581.1 ATPase V0 complex subunit E1/e2 [Penicillium argentinense]